ncbi:putative hydrolase [Dichotomopilus funicola]|uniref:Hydrolase n=1 Tax=Dichotomopilus funicola TaxID=1934379 RepID=A0AAN6VAN6_9PEZI|nr:putative hydrolase [Dichotomopilus funicola]
MESEEYPAEVILEAIDTMATSQQQSSTPKRPKVILFDIGGVCVISPFQSILNYELRLGIPPGWVNYSISRTAPSGFWHRLETGSIPLDAAFFEGFNRDLHDPARWEAFYRAQHQARQPSSSSPSSTKDLQIPPVPQLDGEWLFNDMMTSATAPDPWMLPALKALRASGEYIVAALSNTVIFPPGHPLATWGGGDQGSSTTTTSTTATSSSTNTSTSSNSTDTGNNNIEDFVSNDPLRQLFDVFVSSAHVGLRKPDPRIYQLALDRVDAFARANADTERGQRAAAALTAAAALPGNGGGGWKEGVRADEVVFLDDIGENLKAARAVGFGTIRVPLGRAYEAVEALEGVTGLRLAGGHPKVPVKPDYGGGRSKI